MHYAFSISLLNSLWSFNLISLTRFSCIRIGSVVLYTGQGKFHDSTKDTLNYVLLQANSTVRNLKDVSSFLTAAKSIGVNQVTLPQQLQKSIDNVNSLITTAANTLDSVTKDNRADIFRYLDAVYVF